MKFMIRGDIGMCNWANGSLNVGLQDLTVCRNRLINLRVEVPSMDLLVRHRSAPERRSGNRGS